MGRAIELGEQLRVSRNTAADASWPACQLTSSLLETCANLASISSRYPGSLDGQPNRLCR